MIRERRKPSEWMGCQWCGGEGCGVCDAAIAERDRAKWRREGTLKPCRKCGAEQDTLQLEQGMCFECSKGES